MQKPSFPILMTFLVLIFSLAGPDPSRASVLPGPSSPSVGVELEGYAAWQGRNDAAIPGNSGTRFSLRDVLGGTLYGYRIEPSWTLAPRHQLRGVFAPLNIEGTGLLSQNVSFQGGAFAGGAATSAVFRFNSYRATYRYALVLNDSWTVMGGLTAKVRDAKISLGQNGLYREKTDFGFVPLLHGALAWRFAPGWQAELEFDAAAAPQGRAEDARFALRRRFSDPGLSITAFYRILEGGAENDKVYTFSLFHFTGVSLAYEFD